MSNARLTALVGTGCCAALLALVPRFEGTVLRTYKDPVAIITACTGHTGPELKLGQKFTPEQCNEMLAGDLEAHAKGVLACTSVPLSDNEKVAYISFAFNVGVDAFCNSTMNRKLNDGDHAGACAELSRWTRAGGRVLPGLVTRRAQERRLCETP